MSLLPAPSSSEETLRRRGRSWPGSPIKEAREIILKDKPDANIVVLPAGSPVTLDYRTDRVRIFVDTVAEIPHIG
ncbi:unnamed protein product [Alopecurus aequalis]